MHDPSAPSTSNLRVGPLLVGALLLLVYIKLAQLQPYQSNAGRSFLFLSADELRFWLAHWLLATPGIILIAVAHGSRGLRSAWNRLLALTPRGWRICALCYFGLLTALAVAGRSVFLLDLPITDDENVVVFGARMLLNGELSVPILQPEGTFTEAFTYRYAGRVSALAYPGAQWFRAASIATGFGSLMYALVAAGGGLAVAAGARVVAGRRDAIVAACWWLCSPMAFTLAMTTHEQLVSRSFLAVAIWLYLRLINDASSGAWSGAVLALVGGMAFSTRSPEAFCVLVPIAIHLVMASARDPRILRATLAASVVSVSVLAFYAWHNLGTTGAWYLPARLGPGLHQITQHAPGTPLSRVGLNFGHNLLLLLVMALGPLGAIFVVLGYTHRPAIVALSSGVVLQLCLGLLHNDTGIHTVGPIHLSEMLPALVLLATMGLLRFVAGLREYRVPHRLPVTAIAAYILGGIALFSVIHGYGLRMQAKNTHAIYDAVEAAEIRNAIVIGEPPRFLIHSHPDFRQTGSWVHWFPPPDPYFRDDVLFAYADGDVEALQHRFPKRRFYRMTYHHEGAAVRIAELDSRPVQHLRSR